MYKTIKNSVDICQAIEHYTGKTLVSCGTDTYELEDTTCPWCSSHDSFRVTYKGGEAGIASCFSEGKTGMSVIDFVAELKKIEPIDAVKLLAKDFNIDLPKQRALSPKEEVLQLASDFYSGNLFEKCDLPVGALDGKTPLQYQNEVRKHSTPTLKRMKVGWSNGSLCEYLTGIGKEEEFLREIGLATKGKKLKDMIPANTFVYSHKHNGKVVRLSMKDPTKESNHQPPNSSRIIDYSWYNMDSVRNADVVIVVEGENDVIAIVDSDWVGGVIGANGSISGKQIEWLRENCAGKHVVTMFDPDKAGDLYRKKINNISSVFTSIVHCKMVDEDIDEFLKAGGTLKEAMNKYRVEVSMTGKALVQDIISDIKAAAAEGVEGEEVSVDSDEEISIGAGAGQVIEDKGCYWKIKYTQAGGEKLVPITNFVMAVRNVYTLANEKSREIIIRTQKGFTSDPVIIDSADKVSLNAFRRIIANASDSSFYGTDADLTNIWEHVYEKSRPGNVFIPDTIGVVRRHRGWLFANIFIDRNGVIHEEGKEGICWVGSNKKGMKPRSLTGDSDGMVLTEVPRLYTELDKEERHTLLEDFTRMFAQNLGNIGMALTMVGWAWANAYSNDIFKAHRAFPFLYTWGGYGSGKTELMKFLLACYDMEEYGYTTVGALRSGVGFERKAAFYESLPLLVDEMRADAMTKAYYPKFRGWYNRSPRSLGDKDADKVRIVPVRSNFIFCGQDIAVDSAVRERGITLGIPKDGREKEESYAWFTSNNDLFSAIGLHWILEAQREGDEKVLAEIKEVMSLLKATCESSRTRFLWGVAGCFGRRLRDMFFPGFDYEAYMINSTTKEALEIKEDDMIAKFFGSVESLLTGDRPILDHESIMVQDNKLLIWFNHVSKEVRRFYREEDFSDTAIRSAITGEDYYCPKPGRATLGKGVQRRVIALDLDKAPDMIKRVAASVTANG